MLWCNDVLGKQTSTDSETIPANKCDGKMFAQLVSVLPRMNYMWKAAKTKKYVQGHLADGFM